MKKQKNKHCIQLFSYVAVTSSSIFTTYLVKTAKISIDPYFFPVVDYTNTFSFSSLVFSSFISYFISVSEYSKRAGWQKNNRLTVCDSWIPRGGISLGATCFIKSLSSSMVHHEGIWNFFGFFPVNAHPTNLFWGGMFNLLL